LLSRIAQIRASKDAARWRHVPSELVLVLLDVKDFH
jgi:hypothetical protein